MPKNPKSKKNNTVRRHEQVVKIREKGLLIMRSCISCINEESLCVVHRSSDKCARCLEKNVLCDLMMSFENGAKLDFDRAQVFAQIKKRRQRIKKNVAKFALIQKKIADDAKKLSRLAAIQETLKKKNDEMIARESQNLKKIDEDETVVETDFFFTFEIDGNTVPLNLNFFDDIFSKVFKHSSNAF